MRCSTCGLAAAAALTANAIMIPSTVSMPDVESDGLNLILNPAPEQTSRRVQVKYATLSENSYDPVDDDISELGSLALNFETSSDRSLLKVNDHTLFPTPEHLNILTAPIIDGSDSTRDVSYDAVFNGVPAGDGTDAMLTNIDMVLNGVDGIDAYSERLTIRVLQDEEGRISIVDIVRNQPLGGSSHDAEEVTEDLSDKQAFDGEEDLFSIQPIEDLGQHSKAPAAPQGEHVVAVECPQSMPLIFCRMRAMIASKIESMRSSNGWKQSKRPCPGMMKKPPVHGGVPKFVGQMKDGEARKHGHHGHHGHHRHHSFCHRVLRALHLIIVGFVVPVVIGIAAGMSASILGMMVGTLVAWVWIKFVRGGRRGHASERAQDGEAEEKEGLLMDEQADEEEALPVYVEKE